MLSALFFVTLHPYTTVFIFFDVIQSVIAQTNTISWMSIIVFECISVEFIQPVPGAEP